VIQIVDYISGGKYGLFEVDEDGETRLLQRGNDIESLLYFGSFAPDPTVLVSDMCMILLDWDKKPTTPTPEIFNEIIEKLLDDVLGLDYNDEYEEDDESDIEDDGW